MNILKKEKVAIPVIFGLSIAIPLVVLFLMYMPERFNLGIDAGVLPFFHAVLNGLTAILLITGFYLIKNNERELHKKVMITAFLLSSIFLVSYVLSKISNDPVPYGGEGIFRYIYFSILVSHIILSGIIIPLVLFTMYRGLKGDFQKHRKIAKWTYPVWLYVTISGVLVYIFMYPYY